MREGASKTPKRSHKRIDVSHGTGRIRWKEKRISAIQMLIFARRPPLHASARVRAMTSSFLIRSCPDKLLLCVTYDIAVGECAGYTTGALALASSSILRVPHQKIHAPKEIKGRRSCRFL